jgi:hypothetical protein
MVALARGKGLQSEGYTGGSRDIPDYGTGNSAPRIAQLMKEAVYAVAD